MRSRRPTRPHRPLLLLVLPLLAGLVLGLIGLAPASASNPAWGSVDSRGHTSFSELLTHGVPGIDKKHSTTAASHALKTAQTVLSHKTQDLAGQLRNKGDDATMALTNLFQHRDELSRADRQTAARVLARPGGGARICNDAQRVCVHYYRSGSDRSSAAWAEEVLSVTAHVAKTYRSAGYRRPVGDGTKGGHNDYVDIYLADIAPQGYYGYCAPEKGRYVATSYCVLDNDYKGYPRTPAADLKVTAAHEFFHAVQFAYDVNEDVWFMESTATWAEDELYSGINDNRQYLRFGQLRKPRTPLDKRTTFGVYGNWIFFRYISEHKPQKRGALPSIMLQMWKKAAVSGDRKHNKYSVRAIASALQARHTDIKRIYSRFSAANLHPRISYREGGHYHPANVAGVTTLKPAKKRASGYYKVAHLASATRRFRPHNLGSKWRLHVAAHLPKHKVAVAVVTVYRKHKTVSHYLKLGRKGNGSTTVRFDNHRVKKVELTLVNTGHGYRCHKGTRYACNGKPTTGSLKDTWSARLVRG